MWTSYWLNNYIPEPNSGCWIYLGATDRNGYCRVKIKGQYYAAHRKFYDEYNGPIPIGLKVLHKCDVLYPYLQ